MSEPTSERKISGSALASSAPDENHLLWKIVRFLNAQNSAMKAVQFVSAFGSVLIVMLWVVAKFGVPAILVLQTLILQLHSDNTQLATADREIQKEQVTATRQVLDQLQLVSGKIDNQGRKLDEQGNQIEQLAVDVGTLKREQVDASKRITSIAAEQRRLRATQESQRSRAAE